MWASGPCSHQLALLHLPYPEAVETNMASAPSQQWFLRNVYTLAQLPVSMCSAHLRQRKQTPYRLLQIQTSLVKQVQYKHYTYTGQKMRPGVDVFRVQSDQMQVQADNMWFPTMCAYRLMRKYNTKTTHASSKVLRFE